MEAIVVIVGLIVLVLDIYAAILFGGVAQEKGYDDKKTAVIVLSMFLPLAGYLLACALPDRSQKDLFKKLVSSSEQKKAIVDDELPEL